MTPLAVLICADWFSFAYRMDAPNCYNNFQQYCWCLVWGKTWKVQDRKWRMKIIYVGFDMSQCRVHRRTLPKSIDRDSIEECVRATRRKRRSSTNSGTSIVGISKSCAASCIIWSCEPDIFMSINVSSGVKLFGSESSPASGLTWALVEFPAVRAAQLALCLLQTSLGEMLAWLLRFRRF